MSSRAPTGRGDLKFTASAAFSGDCHGPFDYAQGPRKDIRCTTDCAINWNWKYGKLSLNFTIAFAIMTPMQDSYIGNTTASQAVKAGSIPVPCSMKKHPSGCFFNEINPLWDL